MYNATLAVMFSDHCKQN